MAKNRKKGKSKDDPGQSEAKSLDKDLIKSKSAPAKAKPKSAAESKKDQIDGIKKTVYPSVLGAIAGFVCFYSPETIHQLPWHFVMFVVVAATFFVQRLTYPFLNIDPNTFQGKDWFYVEFMAIDLWLVTWTLLLN